VLLFKEVNEQFSTFEHHECKEPFERLDHGGMKGAARAAARAWRRREGCVHPRPFTWKKCISSEEEEIFGVLNLMNSSKKEHEHLGNNRQFFLLIHLAEW